MSQINDKLDCCGINEIEWIADNKDNPAKTIEEVCKEMYDNDKTGAYLIFSDIGRHRKAGKQLRKYIIDNKLGTITTTKPKRNPNSGSILQMWIWSIHQKNLKSYWLAKQNKSAYA